MFEVTRDYPTAMAAGSGQPKLAVETGIQWVQQKHRELGGRTLVFAPTKSSIAKHEIVSKFIKRPGVNVMTWRQRNAVDWPGGPVLALWPNRKNLAEIADHHGIRALCVVPWVDGELDAWQAAAKPELLTGATALETDPNSGLDPVVVQGLRSLTQSVNHSNQLAGALDEADAVEVLTTLHRGGYVLPPDAVYAWALANGWPSGGVERLCAMVTKIGSGTRVRTGSARSDILDVWRKQADMGQDAGA